MTEEKKQKLFPIFAFLYSKEMNPEKYGKVTSIEEWTALIQESPEDIEAITQAATQLSDDEWSNIENQIQQEESVEETPSYLKNGAKLQTLKKLKSMKKAPKKCSCGCDMIDKKAAGGKVVSECSCKCGGKMAEGGKTPGKREKSPQERLDLIKQAPTKVRNMYERMKALKIK